MLSTNNLKEALACASLNRSRLVITSQSIEDVDTFLTLNLNKLLTEQLMTISRKERAKSVMLIMEKLIAETEKNEIMLSGIEVLFDRSLGIDPLRLLSNCSKNKTLLVLWPGDKTSLGLSYAGASHPEHRTYKASDLSDVIYLKLVHSCIKG